MIVPRAARAFRRQKVLITGGLGFIGSNLAHALVAAGAKFLPFPQSVMEACFNASNELYAETVAKNPKFKKMHDAYMAYRNDQYLWWQVAEYNYDNFMIRQRARGG